MVEAALRTVLARASLHVKLALGHPRLAREHQPRKELARAVRRHGNLAAVCGRHRSVGDSVPPARRHQTRGPQLHGVIGDGGKDRLFVRLDALPGGLRACLALFVVLHHGRRADVEESLGLVAIEVLGERVLARVPGERAKEVARSASESVRV